MSVSRRLVVGSLTAAALAAASPWIGPAVAIDTVRPLAGGPVFTDGGVAWATHDRDLVSPRRGYGFVVRSQVGGAERVLGSSRPARLNVEQRDPYLLSSSEVLVAGAVAVDPGSRAFSGGGRPAYVLAWPPSATAPVRFGGCSQGAAAAPLRPGVVDLDGHEVVSCNPDGQHLDIFDGRTSQLVDQVPAGRPVSARIAGPYVAWLEPPVSTDFSGTFTLVVFDRRSRQETLRVPTTILGSGVFGAWDLDGDGTIAYAVQTAPSVDYNNPMRLGWISGSEPTPHAVGAITVRHPTIRLVAKQIFFSTLHGRAFDIGRIGLDGSGSRTLTRGTTRDFDVDATRLAFGVPGCDQDMIRVRPLAASTFTATARRCALPVSSTTLKRRGSRLPVTLRCRSLPRMCDGSITLRLRRTGEMLGRGFVMDGQGSVVLRTAALRALRREHHLAARLSGTFSLPFDQTVSVQRSRAVEVS